MFLDNKYQNINSVAMSLLAVPFIAERFESIEVIWGSLDSSSQNHSTVLQWMLGSHDFEFKMTQTKYELLGQTKLSKCRLKQAIGTHVHIKQPELALKKKPVRNPVWIPTFGEMSVWPPAAVGTNANRTTHNSEWDHGSVEEKIEDDPTHHFKGMEREDEATIRNAAQSNKIEDFEAVLKERKFAMNKIKDMKSFMTWCKYYTLPQSNGTLDLCVLFVCVFSAISFFCLWFKKCFFVFLFCYICVWYGFWGFLFCFAFVVVCVVYVCLAPCVCVRVCLCFSCIFVFLCFVFVCLAFFFGLCLVSLVYLCCLFWCVC